MLVIQMLSLLANSNLTLSGIDIVQRMMALLLNKNNRLCSVYIIRYIKYSIISYFKNSIYIYIITYIYNSKPFIGTILFFMILQEPYTTTYNLVMRTTKLEIHILINKYFTFSIIIVVFKDNVKNTPVIGKK